MFMDGEALRTLPSPIRMFMAECAVCVFMRDAVIVLGRGALAKTLVTYVLTHWTPGAFGLSGPAGSLQAPLGQVRYTTSAFADRPAPCPTPGGSPRGAKLETRAPRRRHQELAHGERSAANTHPAWTPTPRGHPPGVDMPKRWGLSLAAP